MTMLGCGQVIFLVIVIIIGIGGMIKVLFFNDRED